MSISPETARAIRRACFARRLPLNPRLLAAAAACPNNAFLTNPASQNVYLYLVDYVRRVSQSWWGRGIESIRVLDWGCGKGHITFLLRELGADVTACDLPDAAGMGEGEPSPILREAGAEMTPLTHEWLLPFEDGRFDVVLSFGVLEHVPSDADSLKQIRRVLAPSGLLLCFFLPHVFSWTQRLSHLKGNRYHDRLYGERSIRRLLREAGLGVLDIWHRQLLPKIHVRYPRYHLFEAADQFLTTCTPLKYLATNIEFAACRQ